MVEFLNPWDLPYPDNGLHQGVATRDFVLCGGMAWDPELGRRADADSIGAETRICLEEVRDILLAAGSSPANIIKVTCYLTDHSYRQEFCSAYQEFMGEYFAEGPFPVRSTFVAGIAAGCRVEIDAVAVRPGRN